MNSGQQRLRRLLIKQQLEETLTNREQRWLDNYLINKPADQSVQDKFSKYHRLLQEMPVPPLSKNFTEQVMNRLPQPAFVERSKKQESTQNGGTFRFAAAAAAFFPLLLVSVMALSGVFSAAPSASFQADAVTFTATGFKESYKKVPVVRKAKRAFSDKRAKTGRKQQLVNGKTAPRKMSKTASPGGSKKAPDAYVDRSGLSLKRRSRSVRRFSEAKQPLLKKDNLKKSQEKAQKSNAHSGGGVPLTAQTMDDYQPAQQDKPAGMKTADKAAPAYRLIKIRRKVSNQLPVIQLAPVQNSSSADPAVLILLASELLIRLLLLLDLRNKGWGYRFAALLGGSLFLPWWLRYKYKKTRLHS